MSKKSYLCVAEIILDIHPTLKEIEFETKCVGYVLANNDLIEKIKRKT